MLQSAAAKAADEGERARLEYLAGLLLIESGREVEGSLALERAGEKLDLLGLPQPALECLFEELGLERNDLSET